MYICPVYLQGERNYHIFYEFVSGLDTIKKEELAIAMSWPGYFFYLNQVCLCCRCVVDGHCCQ